MLVFRIASSPIAGIHLHTIPTHTANLPFYWIRVTGREAAGEFPHPAWNPMLHAGRGTGAKR